MQREATRPASMPTRFARWALRRQPQRIIDPTTGLAYGNDLLGAQRDTAVNRRVNRTNTDVVALQSSVFAAVNFIAQRVQRPRVVLQQRRGDEWQEITDPEHPAALHHRMVNVALTWAEALSVAVIHRLTNGNAYWVKRRTPMLGVPVEFEIWNPNSVQVRRERERPWVPTRYVMQHNDGRQESVEPQDMVPFRGLIDPTDLLNGLSPITAVRLQAEMSLEATRYNIHIFDNAGRPSEMYTSDELSPHSARVLEEELQRRWAGTDKAHQIRIVEGGLEPVDTRMTPRDMEFMAGQKWTVIEVARAFDLSPLALKDFDRATYENAPEASAQDWGRVLTELRAILNTINVHCLKPDFSEDLRLYAPGDDIPELQVRRKEQAEIDKIYLDTGKMYINEARERDGQDAVPWGDEPFRIKPPVTTPLDQDGTPPTEKAAARAVVTTPSTANDAVLLALERQVARAWAGRLRNEMRDIIAHLAREGVERHPIDKMLISANPKRVDPKDVETYDWDWISRYGERVIKELADVYVQTLTTTGFVETPALAAQDLAQHYARGHAGELIQDLRGTTRRAVRLAVSESIETGASPRELRNILRALPEFSTSRAEMIARTETAFAQGEGANAAARSQGRDEKRWMTAQDDRVSPTICAPNEAQRWIGIDEEFQSGHMMIPGHPRCRCRVQYRTKRLRT
jgi:HK97 family phage portal protein